METVKKLGYFLPVILLGVILYYAGQSPNNPSKLEEVAFARSINSQTAQPVEKTDRFYPNEDVYISFKVNGFLSEIGVKVEWYQKTNNKKLGEDTTTVNGSRYLSFVAESPNNGWPVGDYQTEIYLDSAKLGVYDFSVVNNP